MIYRRLSFAANTKAPLVTHFGIPESERDDLSRHGGLGRAISGEIASRTIRPKSFGDSRARCRLISEDCRRRRRSKSASRTRPASARRTARNAALANRPTSAMTTPICSARSAQPAASERLSALPDADTDMMQLQLDEIVRHSSLYQRSQRMTDVSPVARSYGCEGLWLRPGCPRRVAVRKGRMAHHGQARRAEKQSLRSCCLRVPRSSTRWRKFGSISARTGSQTPSSKTSDAIIDAAASPGANSSAFRGDGNDCA